MKECTILQADALVGLRTLPSGSAQCCVTSPPYFGLRDYGVAGQIGLEDSPEAYVARLVEVFAEVRRVLRDDGVLWLNLGDSYAGSRAGPQGVGGLLERRSVADQREMRAANGNHVARGGAKAKDLLLIPAMVALALRADGWFLRSKVIWAKPNPMPESVFDRPTSAYEEVFLLSKSERYFYDHIAISEEASVPGWDDGSRTYGGVNKAVSGIGAGARTKGRVAGARQSVPRGGFNGKPGDAYAQQAFRAVVERRNARNVWTIASQPFSARSIPGWDEDHDHYAVMPPDLAGRCILAGTSERGGCAYCGAPWVREFTAREVEAVDWQIGSCPDRRDSGRRERDPGGAGGSRLATVRVPTGAWIPSCSCPAAPPVPQLVLDPFGGAGTTALVADRLGRSSILVELSAKNCRLARARLTADAPLLAAPIARAPSPQEELL